MKIDELYSTNTRYQMGDTVNQYQAEATASSFGTSPLLSVDSYFLGYINKSNLPYAYGMSVVYYDDENNLIFKDITQDINFPCGYALVQQSIGEEQHFLYYKVNDTITYTPAPRTRMLNQNYPMYSGRSMYRESVAMQFGLSFVAYDGGGNIINPDNYAGFTYCNFETVGQALDFLRGNSGVSVNIMTYQSDTITVRINADNMASGNAYLESESGGYFVRLLITNFDCTNGCSAYNGGTQTAFRPQFMAKVTGEYNGDNYEVATCGSQPNVSISLNYLESLDPSEDNPFKYYRCRLGGEFAESQISDLYLRALIYNGNVCLLRSRNSIDVAVIHDMSEISHAFYLAYRGDISTNTYTTGYVRGVTYATDVSANNEFLAQWKTGDLSDATFRNGLRDWQYTDDGFQSDDFTEEDVPPPGPEPEPRPDPEDPGDEETTGDTIEFNDPSGLGNGFGFTTMYGIRAIHLREIGEKLWTGFDNINDYINNFVFAVDPDTGSVNLADIMQFFISLRAYPCPLSAMASTTAGGTDMYIGSGVAPLPLSTPFSIVDSYIGYINAGSVSLPYWYGDYRDFSLQIICYLPYCGTLELNPGDVMGATLSAFYTVDFCSGACIAYVTCTTWEGATILVGSLPGQLGADIPLTATNAGQVAARMYGDRINVAQTLLGAAKSGITGVGAIMSGNWAGAARSGLSALLDPALEMEKHYAEMGSRSAIAAPMLSGGRGLSGFGTVTSAYVQIRSPYYATPTDYGHSIGYPAADYVQIGSCSGFCQFVNVDVSGITTDAEDQQAIKSALETGVYI